MKPPPPCASVNTGRRRAPDSAASLMGPTASSSVSSRKGASPVRVEWTPKRRFYVIFTRDENGLVGGDFLYKKRLR